MKHLTDIQKIKRGIAMREEGASCDVAKITYFDSSKIGPVMVMNGREVLEDCVGIGTLESGYEVVELQNWLQTQGYKPQVFDLMTEEGIEPLLVFVKGEN